MILLNTDPFLFQVFRPTSAESTRVARSWSGHQRDEITSLQILRSILQPRSPVPAVGPASQTKQQMSEENEETF